MSTAPDPTLEAMLRRVIREEMLGLSAEVRAEALETGPLARAVRAELARAGRGPKDLVEALGLSRPTVMGRLSGTYPFKQGELSNVAKLLGIRVEDILRSSQLGLSFNAERQPEVKMPERDTWAQPPGSRRRRKSASA